MGKLSSWGGILAVLVVAVVTVIAAMDGELCFARCERPANHLMGARAWMMAAGPVVLLIALVMNAVGRGGRTVNAGKRFLESSLLALSVGLMVWAHIGPV